MSKLKFDRLLNLKVESGEVTIVPKGELWRGRVYGINSISKAYVNNKEILGSVPTLRCVEEAQISVRGYNSNPTDVILQGVVFKVVENV